MMSKTIHEKIQFRQKLQDVSKTKFLQGYLQ